MLVCSPQKRVPVSSQVHWNWYLTIKESRTQFQEFEAGQKKDCSQGSKNHSFPVISTFYPVKRTYLEFVYVPSDSLFHLAIGLQNSSYGTFEISITQKILALIIKTLYKSCPYILIAQQRNQERFFKELNKV